MITNYQNYYMFAALVQQGHMVLHTKDINTETWDEYYHGLYNILLDGIEDPEVQQLKVKVVFEDGIDVTLTVCDLMINIIMWQFNVLVGIPINGESLFVYAAITQNTIKKYFDKFIIRIRTTIDIKRLNNAIADTLHKFQTTVDSFSLFLANTVNLKDFIELGNHSQEFHDFLHTSLRDVEIKDVKDAGMKISNKSINYIVNSEKYMGYEHCLKNSFISQEGTNPKQYKELMVHIGTKPNGVGGIIPSIIDRSYVRGMSSVQDQYMDSSAARVAQIQTKENVGTSGYIAHIMGINNIDTFINQDLNYRCNTRNFIKITFPNIKVIERFMYRYFRTNEDGIDILITPDIAHTLVGKTVLLRSPMTCASAAHGHGICAACYGALAYVNYNISVGKFATEQLSEQLTQKQLSAKHLLETEANEPNWSAPFLKYFSKDINAFFANPNTINNTTKIIINMDDIVYAADSDEYKLGTGSYTSYVTKFTIRDRDQEYVIHEDIDLYISNEFYDYMERHGKVDEQANTIEASMKDIANEELCMFLYIIENNELSKTLKEIEHCINLKSAVESHTKDSIIQTMIHLCIEGGIDIQAVHLETILHNQIRDIHSNLRQPDWEIKDVPYRIITLDKALKDNPSIVVSMLYKNLASVFSSPLSFKKDAPSIMDPFFMTQPQLLLAAEDAVPQAWKKYEIDPFIRMPGYKE